MVLPRIFSYFLVALNLVTLSSVLHPNIFLIGIASILFSFLKLNRKISLAVQALLIVITVLLLREIYVPFLDPECFISLLVVLSAIKLSELKNDRDYFNIFMIFILLESGILLLNPTFYYLLLSLGKIFIFLYFILKLREIDVKNLQLSRAFLYTLPVIPITFILFFLTPRSENKLNMMRFQGQSFSGDTKKINFQDLPPINLSNNVAFHVYSSNLEKFPFSSLYWRKNVFWIEKNGNWSSASFNLKQSKQPNFDSSIEHLTYEIKFPSVAPKSILTLNYPSNVVLSSSDFDYFSDGTYRPRPFVKLTNSYMVNTMPEQYWEDYSEQMQSKLKTSSIIIAPKTREWLKTIKQKDPADRLQQLIENYKNLQLEYSLTPSLYQNLDEFLFDKKAGYCSHFATTFASLVRAIGLPSRLVSGYHGGEFNEFSSRWTIREKDAHMWVEVYLQGRWTLIDPTAWIEPDLFDFNLKNKHLPDLEVLGFKIKRQSQFVVAYNRLMMYVEGFNVKVSSMLDDYFLEELDFTALLKPQNIFFLVIPFLIPLLYQLYIQRRTRSVELQKFHKFLSWARSRGVIIEKYEGPSVIKQKCLAALPQEEMLITQKCDDFIKFYYQS